MEIKNTNINFNQKDVNINYFDSGIVSSGEVVLFIHGIGDSLFSFKGLFSSEYTNKFRIVIPDLLGFGNSSKSDELDFSVESQVEMLLSFLERLEIVKLHIVGHSVGGGISVKLVENLIQSVRSLILVEGNLIAEDCGIVTRSAVSRDFQYFLDDVLPAMKSRFINQNRSLEPLEAMNKRAFYKLSESIVKLSDSGDLLKSFLNFPIPKIYVYGDSSRNYPVLNFLSEITKLEVSNSGHRPFETNPEEFYAGVFNFLDSLS